MGHIMTGTSTTSQVLGASTAAVGGIASLPYTSGNLLTTILSYTAISCGIVVLSSFVITRLIKKII